MERSHAYTGRTVYWELHINGERQGDGLRNKADAMAAAEWLTGIGYDGTGDWEFMWVKEKARRLTK
jgi:hypothetical protein